ncbi:heparinase II/III family protein [Streptomyces sp. NPDC014870]|uniref:heparinase II/III domain-containing protein n=1 Tax=Streptomyces sp. NPDC014870 TaxID=3364925 RepID=UPI0036FFFF11
MNRYGISELTALLAASPPVSSVAHHRLREAAGAAHAGRFMAEVREEAALGIAAGPPPQPTWSLYRLFDDTGDRMTYEPHFFARRRRLNALALTALTDDDPAVETALADMLWSVCDDYSWAVPAHAYQAHERAGSMETCVDLFSCEMAHALAEITFLLADRLPDPVVRRVRTEIRRRVLDPLYADPRPWLWESYTHNWSAVCGGAAGMAALLLEDDPAVLASALVRSLRALDRFLSGLAPDGGCAEGVNYWVYGFGYYVYFAEALRARTGLDLLADEPMAMAAARFPAAAQLGTDRYVSFADGSSVTPMATGLLGRLAERFGVPVPSVAHMPLLGEDHCYRWAHLSRDLAWTTPDVLGGAPPTGSAWLPDLGWLTDRRTVDGLPIAFAAKGGHNDEPHNHNDLGHFILSAGGEQLLADLGAGEYRDGYFGPERYTAHLHPSAEAHSLPVVDGSLQRAGREAAAVVLCCEQTKEGVRLELDLSAAYDVPVQVRRSFDWRAEGRLVLTDRFLGAARVDELFISRIRPETGHGTVRWTGSAGVAELGYDGDSWTATVEILTTADHHARPDEVYRLRLTRLVSAPDEAVFEIVVQPRR